VEVQTLEMVAVPEHIEGTVLDLLDVSYFLILRQVMLVFYVYEIKFSSTN